MRLISMRRSPFHLAAWTGGAPSGKIHLVAVWLNFFSKSPKPTLGRKRYTGCFISRTSQSYFFLYAFTKLAYSAVRAPMTSADPSSITAFAASSVPTTHLGFVARFRAFREADPVLNQKLSSSH